LVIMVITPLSVWHQNGNVSNGSDPTDFDRAHLQRAKGTYNGSSTFMGSGRQRQTA
jgi:hypothetical protein